jgi:hypothetical protein
MEAVGFFPNQPKAASSFNVFLILSDTLLIPEWLVRTARVNVNGTSPDDRLMFVNV